MQRVRVLAGPALNLTLKSNGATRRWSIRPSLRDSRQWSFEKQLPNGSIYGELPTAEQALAKHRQFESEIAVSRAEGWE